jgi:PAS domain S-box-containing protein
MGERTRSFDWSKTPVGPVADWPQSLKVAVRIMIDSRYAMWLGWGPEFTFFYNDAYAEMTLGPKHPWALGRPAREVWSEIWADIGPRAESVLRTGQATWDEGLLLFLERRGFPEETYHTFSYSPIPDDRGGVGGMLCVVTEDTERTIGERRLRTLRELAARTTEEARSVEDACQTAARTLADNPLDLPFVLIYLLDDEARLCRLAGTTGLPDGSPAAPPVVELGGAGGWPLRAVLESGHAELVTELEGRFGPLRCGPWPEPQQQAVVVPMAKPGQPRPAGFVVAGVSPRLVFTDQYKGFLDLLAGHVATAVANARAYEEERRRAEALAELDRAKTAFFSNVSHEFRTPLTLMLGPVEDLLARSHTDLPPAAAGQLEVVNRNGLRLLRLVNSLLDFSRIEAGRVRAVYQSTDLATFTADLASVFRSACERAGLRLVVDCPSLGESVFVDREMWEKVVLNLVSNAFKFTFEGEIAVSLRRAGPVAELRVRDTGTGIPAEEMPKVFERFHRIEKARGRTHEGSGIGLALVQELVRLHGGSIIAESVVGEGTTFTITVPLGSSHLPPDQIGEGRTAASTGSGATPYVEEALRWLPDEDRAQNGGRSELPAYHEALPTPHRRPEPDGEDDRPRVLVADDNADMRQYVARLLAEQFRVEVVPDGEAALSAARDRPPDLVLTDVMMPKMSGFGLLKELRADPRTGGLPVIMLSARAGEESRVEGMEAGADDYLVKPFGARELLARVTAHLQMARLRRESERAVRDSESRLRLALAAARMVAWHWDPVEDRVVASDNVADVFGLRPGSTIETSGQGFAIVHPGDVDRHRATLMQAVEECGSYLSQFRMIRPDNREVIWLEERGHAVCEGPGRAVRVVGVVMDITARKRAEDELEEERDRLRVTLASIGDAVITTDTEGRIAFLNGVAESLTGWANADAVGRPLDAVFNIMNEATRQPVESPAIRALRERVIVGLANHTVLIRKDGTERPIDDSAAPVRDGGGPSRRLRAGLPGCGRAAAAGEAGQRTSRGRWEVGGHRGLVGRRHHQQDPGRDHPELESRRRKDLRLRLR